MTIQILFSMQLLRTINTRHTGESHLVRDSGRYPLCGRGDVNTYAIFAGEYAQHVSSRQGGRMHCASGIATDDTTKFFFQDVMETQTLVSLFSI